MDNIEELKKAQKSALKAGNIEELNRINRILFGINEAQRKANERAREEYRYNILSTRISKFCENFDNAKKHIQASREENTLEL